MPNSLNYGSPLTNTLLQRPSRITPADIRLLRMGEASVIFGTSDRDVVELWIYNPDGSFAGHVNLGPTDENLRQATFVDQTGAFETVNINLKNVAKALDIQPGRYSMVANFFRNEVGSEKENKLYIADISDDRTELRLVPVEVTPEIVADLFEFIVPSVPKQFAKGLVDQAFGKTVEAPVEDVLTQPDVEAELGDSVLTRIQHSESGDAFVILLSTILQRTYLATLNLMAADVRNFSIQQIELETYIQKALHAVIYGIGQSDEYDPRFRLVN